MSGHASPKTIDKMIENKDESALMCVADSKNVTPDHISKALDHGGYVAREFIQNDNATAENIHRALDTGDEKLIGRAIWSEGFNHEHLNRLVNGNFDENLVGSALMVHHQQNKGIGKQNIDDIFTKRPQLTKTPLFPAVSDLSSEHIDKLLNGLDKNDLHFRSNMEILTKHKNFTSDNLTTALKHPESGVRSEAVLHSAEEGTLDALQDKGTRPKGFITKDHINTIINGDKENEGASRAFIMSTDKRVKPLIGGIMAGNNEHHITAVLDSEHNFSKELHGFINKGENLHLLHKRHNILNSDHINDLIKHFGPDGVVNNTIKKAVFENPKSTDENKVNFLNNQISSLVGLNSNAFSRSGPKVTDALVNNAHRLHGSLNLLSMSPEKLTSEHLQKLYSHPDFKDHELATHSSLPDHLKIPVLIHNLNKSENNGMVMNSVKQMMEKNPDNKEIQNIVTSYNHTDKVHESNVLRHAAVHMNLDDDTLKRLAKHPDMVVSNTAKNRLLGVGRRVNRLAEGTRVQSFKAFIKDHDNNAGGFSDSPLTKRDERKPNTILNKEMKPLYDEAIKKANEFSDNKEHQAKYAKHVSKMLNDLKGQISTASGGWVHQAKLIGNPWKGAKLHLRTSRPDGTVESHEMDVMINCVKTGKHPDEGMPFDMKLLAKHVSTETLREPEKKEEKK
jgi:hypothetical protein